MPLFANRGIQRFENLLQESVEPFSKTALADLRARIGRDQRDLGIGPQRLQVLEEEVDEGVHTVLVVEDDQVLSLVLRDMLTMDGYIRDYATQGATCAQQLR